MPLIVGIDEVGCGALAGPVVAAACWLDPCGIEEHRCFPFIRDSKTLSEAKREEISAFLSELPPAQCRFALGKASREEVETLNVRQASLLAMVRAYRALEISADLVLVDGTQVPSLGEVSVQAIIRGDAQHKSISAASILAKVHRDREMRRLHASFPAYGWDQNKGYGTRAHCAAIQAQGLSPHHRRTFVSNVDRWGARAEKDDTVSSRTS